MADPGAPPSGWLLDPDDPTLLRWWDGAAWSAFRRPRDLVDAPRPPAAAPEPAPEPAPEAAPDPTPAPAPWTPQPLPPTSAAPPAPPAAETPPDAPPTAPPFWEQWDEVVLSLTGPLAEDTRRRRQEVAARIREQVVAGATAGERVLRVVPVSVHDEARSGDRIGARLFVADLLVTDHRLLLWLDETDPTLALIEVAAEDVAGFTVLPGPAALLTLVGDARPLVLGARDQGRRTELVDLLHATLRPR